MFRRAIPIRWLWPLALPSVLLAQNAVQGTARASIVQPMQIVELAPMDFGRIAVIPGGGGGNVDLDHNNALAMPAGLMAAPGVAPTAGRFAVDGIANAQYNVTFNPLQFNLNRVGAGAAANMQVTIGWVNFTSDAGQLQPANNAQGVLAANGTDDFRLWSTLAVAANQAAGDYQGAYQVTVVYN